MRADMVQNHEDAYELLIQAIIKQAMADYKVALKEDNHKQISELERFFRSSYGETLSHNHGEEIIEYCRKEVEEEEESEDESEEESEED